MTILKQPYAKWRDKLLPLIEQTERRNQHEFARQIDEALLKGSASLFLVDDGFFVLEPKIREGVLHVCVLFAFSFVRGAADRQLPVIEMLAKEVGAQKLLFWTAVKKLHSVLIKHGFSCVESGDIDMWCKVI